ncbi:hypothetical protein [Mucilaginibacter sp.]|uniref:hypothetical protein n=1 Tax=Mucilaginibacter sp. TaxID=1882438 RepID=UPI003D11DCA1
MEKLYKNLSHPEYLNIISDVRNLRDIETTEKNILNKCGFVIDVELPQMLDVSKNQLKVRLYKIADEHYITRFDKYPEKELYFHCDERDGLTDCLKDVCKLYLKE